MISMPAFARTAGSPRFRRLIYRVGRELKMRRVWIGADIAGGPELAIGGLQTIGRRERNENIGIEEETQIKSTHIELGECPR